MVAVHVALSQKRFLVLPPSVLRILSSRHPQPASQLPPGFLMSSNQSMDSLGAAAVVAGGLSLRLQAKI
jgi:hypothetical protein